MTRLAVWIATCGPAGFAPVAPGTVGSAVGLVLFIATARWPFQSQVLLAMGIVLLGAWSAAIASRALGRSDPAQVVIDEVAGQYLTFLGLSVGWGGLVAGFVLFRALDIIKPWPANKLDEWHGGVGVMADDVMAAIYAHLLLRAAIFLLPGLT